MLRAIKIFLLCTVVFTIVYSCSKDVNKNTNTKEANGIVMNLTGRFDGCGFVIKLDSGNSLEVRNIPDGITLEDNKRVHIKYEEVNGASICMIGPIANILELKYL